MSNTRKEYNDRWNAPLVNPPITLGEYEAQRATPKPLSAEDAALVGEFMAMLAHDDAKQNEHYAQVVRNSQGK